MLIVSKPVSDEVIKQAQQLGVKRIGCNMGGTSRTMVEKAKKEGLIVSLWPGQSIEDFILGVALGADALCSDMAVGVKEFAKKNMPWVDLN
jgi:glycerophosphoryl diester phosphodiesterase